MKVFIEKMAGLNQVTSDGETKVMRDYPYPYGYILDTTSGDGKNVDCYIITQKKLDIGSIVDAEPIGFMEYFEDGKEDHKVLSALENEPVPIDAVVKAKLNEFAKHFFDHRPGKIQRIGNYFGKDKAEEYIRRCEHPHQ
ncbi:MAG: inorganic diphosphatase [Patescibacteria group bacterium]|nr:inorganic diphosphatase [Patescibacteria group bacterium]